MGIFKDFFNTLKERKTTREEEKFNKLDATEKQIILNKVLEQKNNAKVMAGIIEKEPYLLPYLIADLKGDNVDVLPLVDIALSKGVNIYDILDKNNDITNEEVVNLAVANHPDIIFELEDNKKYANLLTVDTIISAFRKNPEVMFSDCAVLDSAITLSMTAICKKSKDGKNVFVREYEEGAELGEGEYVATLTRQTTLRTQLKRALNLYFRPESYSARHFDYYAKEIANGINGEKFVEKVQGNRMTTRVTTAANETLKRNPEKGKVVPASTLHRWNNRVLYTLPSEARKQFKKNANDALTYVAYLQYLTGLLENPSLNSFTEEEKTRLAKRCVSIIPDIYEGLYYMNGYEKIAEKLTVQLSAYEAYKAQGDEAGAKRLLQSLSEKQAKKLLAKNKANGTRRKNARAKAKTKTISEELELK